MFSITVDVDGLYHKLDTLAESAADLEEPLRIFGGWLLKKTRDRYKAQSFTPLAEATIAARAQQGLHSLQGKLQSDVRRAFGRARQQRGEASAKGATGRSLQDVLGLQSRGVQNRLAVLAEFQRHNGATWGSKGGTLAERVEAKSVSLAQAVSLGQREARAVMRAVGRPILGGLDRTLIIVVDRGSVTLKSATHEQWSEAHNKGASVGHGATLPQRKTIFVEHGDVQVLTSILKSHLLLPFEEGMHGPGF